MRNVLEKLAKGDISVDDAEKLLKVMNIEVIEDFCKFDLGRSLRKGIPEIILAEGKTPENVRDIALSVAGKTGRAIISRANSGHIAVLKEALADGYSLLENDGLGTFVLQKDGSVVEKTGGKVAILTGGTSDIPIAEEAHLVAREMGCEVITAYDVGVAGMHRLFQPLKEIVQRDVDVLIVVAGREGALPTVVSGLVDIPIIAVPTSSSWGLGEKGLSALTAMLQACSLGLTVVNIDGGVAAGAAAALMANKIARARKSSS